MVMAIKLDGGSNDEREGGNDEGGDNADGDVKDGGRDDCDDRDDIDFEDDDGVSGEFLQSNFVSISTLFDTNLSFPGLIRCRWSLKYNDVSTDWSLWTQLRSGSK